MHLKVEEWKTEKKIFGMPPSFRGVLVIKNTQACFIKNFQEEHFFAIRQTSKPI